MKLKQYIIEQETDKILARLIYESLIEAQIIPISEGAITDACASKSGGGLITDEMSTEQLQSAQEKILDFNFSNIVNKSDCLREIFKKLSPVNGSNANCEDCNDTVEKTIEMIQAAWKKATIKNSSNIIELKKTMTKVFNTVLAKIKD